MQINFDDLFCGIKIKNLFPPRSIHIILPCCFLFRQPIWGSQYSLWQY